MLNYFADAETIGFHGVPILLQYAINKGPVQLVHIWTTPAEKLMAVIEDMCRNRVIAHNLRFDWFHISKLYNMLRQFTGQRRRFCDHSPTELAEFEWQSQFGLCLKPAAAIDTMLLASKSEDQSFLMDSKAVRVRRVPLGMAAALCNELNERTDLPWILFAKKGHPDLRWEVADNKDRKTGEVDPLWKDVKISFQPSKGLKDLAVYLCDHETPAHFEDIMCENRPAEEGYAPFAKLLSSADRDWLYDDEPTWPALIVEHAEHWAYNPEAQHYAEDDILMLRKLYEYFGSPEDDEDAIIACQVASVRLRGFAINVPGVREQHAVSTKIVNTAKLNVGSSKQVLRFVSEALDEMEQLILSEGCAQEIIDSIKQEFTLDEQEDCYCDAGTLEADEENPERMCARCEGVGTVGPGPMPVVERVEHIETIRRHRKRIELFDKLLLAKRAYPDFNVIGTKSGRMSGASGLNFHGIDNSDVVRSLFTLSDHPLTSEEKSHMLHNAFGCEPLCVMSAGDYSSQELAIAATTMQDEALMRDMESGKSLHGLFAAEAFETTYEDIMSNKDDGRYGKAKGGVYAILYGGTFETVAKNMGIEVKVAEAAYNRLCAKYPQMGITRQAVTERFSSMKQDADGKINYVDPPKKFIESVFGFRRYFETEYYLQRVIIDVIKNMPQDWKDIDVKVERTEGRLQSVSGALCSSLYGAAFSIQNKIIRASNNHVIQSTGRHLTIGMQYAVWELQPAGIHDFLLTLMSIHDELAVISERDKVALIQETVETKVEEQCETVPLTSIDWFVDTPSWADKGSGENKTVIGWKPEGELV